MSMSVLVEPLADGAGYRASTGAPLNLTATGPTPEAALDEIGRLVADLWDRGAKIYTLPGIPPTRTTPRGPINDEVERLYQEGVAEYRDRCDREAEAEYGITIDRSAP